MIGGYDEINKSNQAVANGRYLVVSTKLHNTEAIFNTPTLFYSTVMLFVRYKVSLFPLLEAASQSSYFILHKADMGVSLLHVFDLYWLYFQS